MVLLSISCVCAMEDLSDSESNFTVLSQDLSIEENVVNITNDYNQGSNDEFINISKSMDIKGNGYSINSNDTIKFNIVSGAKVNFRNLTFNCSDFLLNIENYNDNESVNITFIDCTFTNQNTTLDDEIHPYGYDWGYGHTCNITTAIKNLAFSIIGKSTGLAAAKKLTQWVSDNIGAETRAGFYQTPTQTLERKWGNCCSQTDLLLQMMDAVGITKDHKVYFVHVGTNEFGKRHYFAIIDNLCIDPGMKKPWGHARFGNNSAEIIEYPLLPFPYGEGYG